ncbi:MAG TPA: hypothetical protein VGR32_05200 [Brevundimonas sp.]|uniref:DUF6968 family protein n=1 Tax=Brevundimonas sp. TaxID=1871086 RepID=UPI002DEABEE4|nr:hypothetical protein [Brevundimonas sp.]
MSPPQIIASLSLDAVRADGEKIVIALAIGAPSISERHQTWACTLTLHPLLTKPQEVAGADSVQALSLTLRAARGILEDFTEKGGKLLLDAEAFPVDVWLGPRL